ncbi:hypothetical protein HDU93_006549 [Gonapodya sp. JEL0774]|nr:hypothetical protein HDU93_006549 [Gonapodya sp. JEL0774]
MGAFRHVKVVFGGPFLWEELGFPRLNIVTDSASSFRPNMRRNRIATKVMTGPKLKKAKQVLVIRGPAIIIAEPPNLDESEDANGAAADFTLDDLDAMLAIYDDDEEMEVTHPTA